MNRIIDLGCSAQSAGSRFRIGFIGVVLSLACLQTAEAAGKHVLEESADQSRAYTCRSHLVVQGQLQTATGGGKAVALKLAVDATLRYRERRLTGTGRDAEAFRSLRFYDSAHAKIDVQRQISFSRLRDERKRIVAQGKRQGVLLYSPNGPLNHGELELLQIPGDSLAVLALLPHQPVEVGDKWNPDSWVMQMITGTEAVLKSDLRCELVSVEKEVATVKFQGELEGAAEGAATTIKIEGNYEYDLKGQHVRRLELTQTEKRSVGSVSPGMDVVAKVVLRREPATETGPLNDKAVAKVPFNPDPALLMLRFRAPWNVRFSHDRNWHVFHQTNEMAILRLVEKGSLIAQCNVSRIQPAAPGEHTSEAKFRNDVAGALGKRLKIITKAEQMKAADKRFVYRVTALGESNGIPMHWIYYLCADPAGRQTVLVFSVETKLLDQLSKRDLAIVGSLEFITPKRPPMQAAP